MDLDPDTLINGYLDDQLADEQALALNDWVKQDPAHARRFALALLRHDRLRDRFRTAADLEDDRLRLAAGQPPSRPFLARWRRPVALAAVAAVVLIASLILLQGVSNRRANATETQLDRLIEVAGRPGDRTYRIVDLDREHPRPAQAAKNQGRPRPPIDGAMLHVRGEGHYVLVRQPGEATEFVTGSNGREAWSIPPDVPVRVSPDPTRFRGAVPGEQQDLSFLNLKTALTHLREAYEIELASDDADEPGPRLLARQRSAAYRGPRIVEIQFDDRTGLIRRMRMDGLPQAQGGPRALALELVNQSDLGRDFFERGAHHAAGRRVVQEAR
jgi:hypothetical protein